jgi:bifunctional DNA-binding transcriptional regulator/antitoxin component of YhaV-PrlF toxin-antitoxin module
MHDARTSTALRQLADLGRDPDPPRWHWAIARVEATGRLVLPAEARSALGATSGQPSAVRGGCNRVALVLRTDGAGAVIVVDRRGRLRLPVWLRRAAAGSGSLLVGTRHARPMVVIASTGVLDGLGDTLAGEPR